MAGADETAPDEQDGPAGLAEAAARFAAAPFAQDAPCIDAPGHTPVVAIGASAGGLEAIEQFFAAVAVPSPFAFIIIQHLSPDFKSLMVELLARRTALAVRAVEDGMVPAANAIHLIPPATTMTIEGGLLRLAERDERDLVHHPIDEFFVSLATDRRAAALGVVLSGSGNDGSRGARAIRRAGGRVLVQLPATAKFSSMPQSAIEAGCNDEVMAPDAMAQALLQPGPTLAADDDSGTDDLPASLVACLDQTFGIDFSAYRNETVQRRVQRRMMLRGFDRTQAYADFVADDRDEQEALYQDLLIGVTTFFRDIEAFEALAREVVPDLASQLDAGEEVRIWVPACATGEEAYSIAVLILAQCRRPLEELQLRIFATDVHRRSLAVAAAGFYSEEAVTNVRGEWLRRYFSRHGSGYQVLPAVRRTLVFSPHDLLRDPPFTNLALLSCRNLLIYLRREAQARVIDGLAFALLPGGHLLLGASESVVDKDDAFIAIDREARLFRRRRSDQAPGRTAERDNPAAPALPTPGRQLTVAPGGSLARDRRDQRLTIAHELLLDRYVPPSLLVDDSGQVVHCFGDAGPYLKPPRGRPSLAVLDMVRDELRAPLASAINRVRRTGHPTTLARLILGSGTTARTLQRLVVELPTTRGEGQRCLLVSFDDRPVVPEPAEVDEAVEVAELDEKALTRINDLERDLRFSEESLRNTIDELESANEELQATNEELMAANEELMAANEELHSVNEEMHTVGVEHQRKIEELMQLGQDMESLLQAADLAALFVDAELVVRRFTPALTRYVNLLPQDVGRPLAHVTHRFADVDLAELLNEAMATGATLTRHLATIDGGVAKFSAVPYRVAGERIAGLTLSVQDTSEQAHRDARAHRLELALDKLLAGLPPILLAESATPDDAFTVMLANPAMQAFLSNAPSSGTETGPAGRPLAELLYPHVAETLRDGLADELARMRRAAPADATWPLARGGRIALETLAAAEGCLAILRTALPETPPTA